MVKVSPSWFRKQLRSSRKLWDLRTGREVGVRWLGIDGAAENIGGCGGDGLSEGGSGGGADKMHGEGPFYSYVGEGWMGRLSLGS
jgi:hypothetical protein